MAQKQDHTVRNIAIGAAGLAVAAGAAYAFASRGSKKTFSEKAQGIKEKATKFAQGMPAQYEAISHRIGNSGNKTTTMNKKKSSGRGRKKIK